MSRATKSLKYIVGLRLKEMDALDILYSGLDNPEEVVWAGVRLPYSQKDLHIFKVRQARYKDCQ